MVHLEAANLKLQHRLVQVENSLQRKGADKLILQHCMQQQMHTAAAMHVVVTLVVGKQRMHHLPVQHIACNALQAASQQQQQHDTFMLRNKVLLFWYLPLFL